MHKILIIEDDGKRLDEWMLFTFIGTDIEGTPYIETKEGVLEWHPVEDLAHLPMAEGDRTNLQFAVKEKGMQYGTFVYTPDFSLIKETIQQSWEDK